MGDCSSLSILTALRGMAGVIFPSLLQLPSGITELDDRKQRRLCLKKFRSRDEELSEVDTERELECGICLEVSRKIVLPDCAHTLCVRCFEDWYDMSLFTCSMRKHKSRLEEKTNSHLK